MAESGAVTSLSTGRIASQRTGWFGNRVDEEEMMTITQNEIVPATEPQVIRPEVRTTLVSGTATQVHVQARDHDWTIDEPESLGGTNTGPNPVEILLSALGACQVITFQVWAEKLGVSIDTLDIILAGDLDLRGFFGLDDTVRPGFASIDVAVNLTGPDSADRYAELVAAVEKHCPVLDNLGNTVPVKATFLAN